MWELFAEEKEDWVSCILGGVTAVLTLLVDLPCTLLALISTTLILVWDCLVQGAQQVSELLALEEWWEVEHTLWAISLVIFLHFGLARPRSILLQGLLGMVQSNLLFGMFIFLINGIQGGVVFGGKLFHPTMLVIGKSNINLKFTLQYLIRRWVEPRSWV